MGNLTDREKLLSAHSHGNESSVNRQTHGIERYKFNFKSFKDGRWATGLIYVMRESIWFTSQNTKFDNDLFCFRL